MSENQGSSKAVKSNKNPDAVKGERVAEPSLNMDELRDLADLVEEHGFTDFEFENEKIRVRLSKNPPAQIVPNVQPFANYPAPVSQNAETKRDVSAQGGEYDEDSATVEDRLHKITSPIVGTFYRSPGPDKDAYVSEGDNVSAKTIVCIVEAMKLMNEIEAEVSGEVVKVYVEDGQPVEYGQPLFGIKK